MIIDVCSAKVVVVSINYNGMEDTLRLLDSLDKVSDKVGVVIVDNDSKIKPFEIKNIFNKVELILSKKNGGFGYGNNLGVKHAVEKSNSIEYVFILNNDCIVKNGTIHKLKNEMSSSPNCIACSPLILYPGEERIWFGGGKFTIKNVGANNRYMGQTVKAIKYLPRIYESPFLSGCAIFIRIDNYLRLKGFDERYFMYIEDMDFSLRMNHLGKSVVVKDSVVIHNAHSSIGVKNNSPLSKSNPNLNFYISNVIKGSKLFISSNYNGFLKMVLFMLLFSKWQRNGLRLGLKTLIFINRNIFKLNQNIV
jgi:hypothetical protein